MDLQKHAGMGLFVIFILLRPAWAQAEGLRGRYTMTPVEGGIIRMDSQSGIVSFCRPDDEHWRCDPVQDNSRAVIEKQERLSGENMALGAELARLKQSMKQTREKLRAMQEQAEFPFSARESAARTMDEVIIILDKIITGFRKKIESFSRDTPQRQL